MELTQLAKAIKAECLDNCVMIYVRHLPGFSSIEANSLSRLYNTSKSEDNTRRSFSF